MNHLLIRQLRVISISTFAAFAVLLGGCAATPSQKSLSDWHDAVVAVRDQSTTTFRGVNALAREAQIRRAATLKSLKEEDFQPGLDADAIGVWTRALDILAEYGAALSSLLSPSLSAGVGDATKRFGESIVTSSKSNILQKQPGLATAFGKVGAKIASIAAGRNAQSIMAETDPAIREVTEHMAKMIGDSHGGEEIGVIGTVQSAWMVKADEIRTASFLNAKSPAEKQSVASNYAAALDQRDASIAALRNLKSSIQELASSHTRAAAGGSLDTGAMIANIREQIAFFRDLIKDLKPAKN